MKTVAALLLAAQVVAPRVYVRANPMVVMKGGTVRVTCTVPVHRLNRGVVIGLDPYTTTYKQIEGDQTRRVTYEQDFNHVPCDAEVASCTLHVNSRDDIRVIVPIQVVGCE